MGERDKARESVPQDDSGRPARSAASSKTMMVKVQAPGCAIGAAEAADDDLGAVPLPDGWEIVLDIVAGRDAGQSFRITKSRVIIGRGLVDIPLDDSHVSRRHASLEVYGAACVLLKDLGSTNGTLVNGRRSACAELSDGDSVQIGTTRIAVTIGAPP